MRIQYVNSKGISFDLECDTIRVSNGSFHKIEWKADVESLRLGARIKDFTKDPVVYDITLQLRGDLEERKITLDSMHDAAEYDIWAKTPGRVYFGDFYIECYVLASDTHKSSELSYRTDKTISIYCPYPFWIKEVSYYVPPVDIDGLLEINTVPASLENPHYAECDFILKAYGPLDELFFYVNDNQYRIVTSCEDGEYLLLDTRDETIVKVDSSGNKTNVYSSQAFALDNFKKIPAGSNSIRYKRNYAIEITLFQERSEPKWNEAIPNTHFLIMTENNHPILTEDGYYLIGEEMVGGAI